MKRLSNKRRIALLTIAALASASIISGQIQAQQNVLNLFNWSEYMDPAILKDFEKKFNIKVNVSLFESNEDLIAKLETSGKGQYDLIVPGQYAIPILAKKGLLEKLDKSQLPNFKNLSKKFVSPSYDPGNTNSVAYQWGTVGIVYRKDKVKNFDPSWSLLFDKSKQQGPFIMMDSTREMLGPVLKYLGKSLNTVNKPDLKKALELMAEAKNRSLGFDGGVGGKNKVVASQANYAVAYNGDAIKAADEDKNVGYFVPKEGSVIFVDSMAIPAGAKNSKMAHAFINFILEPKIGARLSNYNRYATPNEAAKPFIDAKDIKNSAVYPAAAIMGKLEFILDLAADNKLYDSIWTKIKAQ
jgi:spermidine/putrescine transport system substrate-binding protein